MSDEQIIKTPQEWKVEAIKALDQSMQWLMSSRKHLLDHKLLTPQLDEGYKKAGAEMLVLLRNISGKEKSEGL